MANITERISKSGEVSYLIRISLGYDITGKQITKSKTWHPEPDMNPKQVKKELNKVATLFEASFERREITRRVKFRDLAEEWFSLVMQTKELNVSTIEQMKSCKERVYDAIGNRYVDDITYRQLQQFILSLSRDGANLQTGKGLSGKTQKHFITFISDVMNYAIRCEIIADNPCRNVTAVKSETKEKDIYSVDEVAAILDALDEKAPTHYQLLFHLLIFYGLRRGEVLGLEWKDIDFDNQTMSINRTSQYRNSRTGTYTSTPKTKTSKRILKISQSTVRLMQRYQFEQNEHRVKLGDQWVETDRLFIGWNGEPLHPNTPYRWLHEFCDEQELAFKGLHAFRHAYATTAITSNAIDMKTVSAVLGHSQTSTTLNIYAHAVAEVNAKAVDVVEDIYTRKRKEA